MAKYRLMKGGTQSVNCELLTESLDSYIVRFSNGVVRDVPKENVYSLDEIDKAVIETVKMRNNEKSDMGKFRNGVPKYNSHVDESWDDVVDFGRKVIKKGKDVVNAIKDFFIGVIKSKNFLFFTSNGEVMGASHPVNVIAGAKKTNCVNFVPGDTVVEMCDENDIDAEAIENFQFAECPYNGASIRLDNFGGVNESNTERNNFMALVEDANGKSEKRLGDSEKILLTSGETYLRDWDSTQIRNRLYNMYIARYKGNFNKSLPLLIWGAPGIGKTSIIRSLKDLVVEQGLEKISIISINGGSVGPDDFTFPAQVTEDIKDIKETKAGNAIAKNNSLDSDRSIKSDVKIADLPKNWLPVYNPDAKNYEEQNKIANGGTFDDKGVLQDGPGGLFFIDEYSRMSAAGMAALMQTPVTRDIGGNSTLTLGDRWVVVCAANRKTDMSTSGLSEALEMEAAVKTRFQHINFVPSVNEWLKWATQKNKDRYDGKFANVIPEITNYIMKDTDNGNKVNDFYEMWSHPDGELDGRKGTASPRTWEALSDALIENYLSDDALEHVNSLLEVSTEDLMDLGSGIVGEQVMARFTNYLSQFTTFSSEDAKNVWLMGDKAKYELLNIKDMSVYDAKYFQNTILPVLEQNITWQGPMPSDNAMNAIRFFELASNNKGAKSFNLNTFKKYCKDFEKYFNVDISRQSPSNPYNDVCSYFLDVCEDKNRI